MTSLEPYTRAEIEALGNEKPLRGVFCPLCNCFIPEFADLSPEEAEELKKHDTLFILKTLRKKTGCNLTWAKIWAQHRHDLPDQPTSPCPYCGVPLHPNAGQCLLCRMDWHNLESPVRLGDSIADQILDAAPGSTINVHSHSVYLLAMKFVKQQRQKDNIIIEFKK
ncbi:hypothetical protein [Gimesia aquarii]|uniref:Uncharacterized protein n=1 Tax=Gimesia aquarii TaxID=2527964 RepID=A0A517W3S9_9PLAN|nr:hypothetical protein [Gimesia aquarii]QDT99912.1 hypothetical protein V144x_54260 [Gimesia aquarii]